MLHLLRFQRKKEEKRKRCKKGGNKDNYFSTLQEKGGLHSSTVLKVNFCGFQHADICEGNVMSSTVIFADNARGCEEVIVDRIVDCFVAFICV